jgi:hypothetical protein
LKIIEIHFHLNGLEYIHYQKINLWNEVQTVIATADARTCLKKLPKATQGLGDVQYSARKLNAAMNVKFASREWSEPRIAHCGAEDSKAMKQDACDRPKAYIKDRSAVDVQFGAQVLVGCELFAKHLSFFVADVIDLGIAILPIKALQDLISSGGVYYEGEVRSLIREGRGLPAVPLILIGVAP